MNDIIGTACSSKFKKQLIQPILKNSFSRSSTIGDFNGDDNPDIAVANSDADNIVLFLSYGNGTFSKKIVYSTGIDSNPYSIVAGDFNNDEHDDIAVANFGTNSISLFFGYGNGTLSLLKILSLGTCRPVSIVVCDFNKDSNRDIITANFATDSISILLGNGDGTFEIQMIFSTGYNSDPKSVAVADFDNDNQMDIAVANSGTNNVFIFLGYTNGSFERKFILSSGIGSEPYAIIVEDFNRDHHLDICVANSGNENIGIFFGYGNGSFEEQITYSTGNGSIPCSVAVGDFNQDNLVDIVVANSVANNIGIFLGYGKNMFLNQIDYSTGSHTLPYSVLVHDFNKNGRSDVLVTNYLSSTIVLLFTFDPSNFENHKSYSTGFKALPISVILADFNNDSWLDIAIANNNNSNVGIYLGYGNATFSNQIIYSTGDNSQPSSIAYGDFNGDYYIDIVVAVPEHNYIGILYGYGNGSFGNLIIYITGNNSQPSFAVVGDFNTDNRLDICVANTNNQNIGILLGYGNGSFADQVTYSTGNKTSPNCIALGDLNNDTHLDIVITDPNMNNIYVFLGYGNGSFTASITLFIKANANPYSVIIGDVNNDKFGDIIVANSNLANIGIFLGRGNGKFAAPQFFSTGTTSFPLWVALGDFNHDNHLDIAVTNSIAHDVGVLIGYGNGSFADVIFYIGDMNSLPVAIALGDLNNDNWLDMIVTNFGTDTINILLASMHGRIEQQMIYFAGLSSRPYSVGIGDLNNDTYLDIVVANLLLDSVGVFMGYGNGSFANEIMYSTSSGSRPSSVTVGDFNNDHRLDIAVANTNTQNIGIFFGNANGTFENEMTYSTGTRSFPVFVSTAYFNNSNLLNIIFVDNNTNNIGILTQQNYSTFSDEVTYSCGHDSNPWSVALGDFNDDQHLDIVVANIAVNNIELFCGYGNGSFKRELTYALRTDYLLYAMVVSDFNNDKRLDIVIGFGNGFLGTLLGNGNGTFHEDVIYSGSTGMEISAVAVCDFDNDSYLDVVFSSATGSSIGIYFGSNNGSFSTNIIHLTTIGTSPVAIAMGDLNRDNCLDMAVAHSLEDSIEILFGYCNRSFSSQATYSTGVDSQPISIALGDFNNDTYLDIAVGNLKANNIGVFLGLGNGKFSVQLTFSTGLASLPSSIAIADLNNDNFLDITVTNMFSFNVGIFYGHGNGSFANQVTYATEINSQPISLQIGDFNNDTHMDIVVANYWSNNLSIFLGYSYVGWNPTTFSTGPNSAPQAVAIGDINNDGLIDAVAANYGTDNIMIFLGHSEIVFQEQVVYSTGAKSGPLSIAVGDFDSNGGLDIAVANSLSNNLMIFFGNGNGNFRSLSIYSLPLGSMPYAIAVGYLNNDNQLDIAVANYNANNIGIFFGFGNGTFRNLETYAISYDSRPRAIALGHFSSENHTDIIVVSDNQNTEYILLNVCA